MKTGLISLSANFKGQEWLLRTERKRKPETEFFSRSRNRPRRGIHPTDFPALLCQTSALAKISLAFLFVTTDFYWLNVQQFYFLLQESHFSFKMVLVLVTFSAHIKNAAPTVSPLPEDPRHGKHESTAPHYWVQYGANYPRRWIPGFLPRAVEAR